MCHINLILRKDKSTDKKLGEYMNYASFNSWKDRNNDGEGFVSIDNHRRVYTRKSLKKLKYTDVMAWFLCTHQRWATIGDGKKNSHPHTSKDFILFHNGVFSNLGDRKKSDTRVYLDLLQRAYTRNKGDLYKALNEIHKTVSGSYSVVLIHKKTRAVYYYKNYYTDMFFSENRKYLVMSTCKDNVEYAKYLLGIKGDVKDAKEGFIYEVIEGDLKPVSNLIQNWLKYVDYKGDAAAEETDEKKSKHNKKGKNKRKGKGKIKVKSEGAGYEYDFQETRENWDTWKDERDKQIKERYNWGSHWGV